MSTPEIGTWGQEKLTKAAQDDGKGLTVMPPQPIATLGILQRAIENTTDVERLGKLWELYKEWDAHESKKAFVAALAAFKKSPPEIAKNRSVKYTNNKGQEVAYKHSTLDRVTGGIGAALGEHGLSARWRTTQIEGGRIRVSCILQHERGHGEETTLEAGPDDSGSKNNIQAIGSTITYLERYTLLAATGLATRDDADGITFGDVEDAMNSLESAITLDELQERFNKYYTRARASKDKASMAVIIEAKDNRKKALLAKNPKAEEQMSEFSKLAEAARMNTAARNMLLGKHGGNLEAAIAEIKVAPTTPRQPAPEQASGAGGTGETRRSAKGSKQKAATEPGTGQNPAAEPAPPKDSPEGSLGF